jgi:tRNA threonylcarbamoyladenosine biosynthesis protein TsaE
MRQAGASIAADLGPGDVVALIGDLGAGKTELVKGLARGLGADEEGVTSPTFTIVQTYRGGRVTLHHVDLYRIDDAAELVHIGLDDLYRDEAVVAVEWFDRFPHLAPRRYLEVAITILSDSERRLDVTPRSR